MVNTVDPDAWAASMVHDLTAWPSTSTTQAPHCDVSQPTWVPVRPSSSRRKWTSRVRSSTVLRTLRPFTTSSTSDIFPPRCRRGAKPAPIVCVYRRRDVCRRHPEALGSMLPPPARVYCTFDRMAADIKIAKRRNAADDARFQPARAGRPLYRRNAGELYARTEYGCGMVALAAEGGGAGAFAAAVAAEAQRSGAQFAFLFFSLSGFDPAELCRALTSEAPELAVVGCSTSGEMLPGGIASGHALAILLPARHFTVIAATIDNIAAFGMDGIAEEVDRLKLALARRTAGHADHRRFAMCLIDGMSFAEERITAALHWALGDIPLIGGSAGDDLRFERTALISEGGVSNGSAVILLVSTALPFSIFKTDNFIPTEAKLVVTASDPDRRVVSELNGSPAAGEYAAAVGKNIEE